MSVNAVASSASTLVTRISTAPTGAVRYAEEAPPSPEEGVGNVPLATVNVGNVSLLTVGVGNVSLVTVAVPDPASGVPKEYEPLAALDSCAKPTAGGLARKTLYTFLRNVSPMIHAGVPCPGGIFEPWVISKIAPTHRPPLPVVPRFRSAILIGHDGPPKDIEMDS